MSLKFDIGTISNNTRITDAETGVPIEGVTAAAISLVAGEPTRATLVMNLIQGAATVEGEHVEWVIIVDGAPVRISSINLHDGRVIDLSSGTPKIK